ncbi:MAG: geranylgeranylglyceryl/heptaprenylglyceryl phosphate synthase [Ignavibacteria bacterium]|nr:geranylgeranylglyceryl/heptaprenylglyceryl phosphate synthase [Ignavibacteria bacterium]
MPGRIHTFFLDAHRAHRPLLLLLLDPDHASLEDAQILARDAREAGVDGLLVGGSLTAHAHLDRFIRGVKEVTDSPVVLFPGGIHQISGEADAILFLSIISGRNPDSLIHQHVLAAPIVRRLGLEAVATAYMLIESGAVSSAEFMSGTRPLPRAKADIAVAHALAAEILGFRMLYLEAGSGAPLPVPPGTIARIAQSVDLPLLVGGGLRSPDAAAEAVRAGATAVVVGTHFETAENIAQLRDFAAAVHNARSTAGIAV